MIFAIDYDGTITANYVFYAQLCSMLAKSSHTIVVLTACNPSRVAEVKKDLETKGIAYHYLISRPKHVISGPYYLGTWKKNMLQRIQADIWIDNEVKNYQDAGVDFNELDVDIIRA